jgi:hypothetical protein
LSADDFTSALPQNPIPSSMDIVVETPCQSRWRKNITPPHDTYFFAKHNSLYFIPHKKATLNNFLVLWRSFTCCFIGIEKRDEPFSRVFLFDIASYTFSEHNSKLNKSLFQTERFVNKYFQEVCCPSRRRAEHISNIFTSLQHKPPGDGPRFAPLLASLFNLDQHITNTLP